MIRHGLHIFSGIIACSFLLISCGETPRPSPAPGPAEKLPSENPATAVSVVLPVPTDTPTVTSVPTDTPTMEPTVTSVPTDTPTPEPTVTSVPTDTPTPEPTVTPVPTNTPTVTPVPTNTPTPEPTVTPVPTARLVLRTDATVRNYWSDGTANVDVIASLHNEGDLPVKDAQPIMVKCNPGADVLVECGTAVSITLPDGYGPADMRFSLRLPMGRTIVEFGYGDEEATMLEVDVPERILGVHRDVWECFSDTSKVGTLRGEEDGIGCAAWPEETIQKWGQTLPVRILIEGPDGFAAVFKDVLTDLSPVVNLQFEWVDAESYADIVARIGFPIPEPQDSSAGIISVGQGPPIFLLCFEETFGCANTEIYEGEVIRGAIVVHNLWPDLGVDFEDFDDWYRNRFRSAMIHEALHVLGRMGHRTELLSVMNAEVHHRSEMSPMDEALLRLQAHELVDPGMTMDTIKSRIVFNDELVDPQPTDSKLAAWLLVSKAYQELRKATSARFKVRSSIPDCSSEFGWADYEVGNLTGHHPYFGWVMLEDDENHIYAIQPHPDVFEYWRQSQSGWAKTAQSSLSDVVPGWRGDLADPHHMLESILYYFDWADADIPTASNGPTVLRFDLDMTNVIGHSPAESVEIFLVVDDRTYEILEYSMAWRLGDEKCDAYLVEAETVQYDIEFAFPETVMLESDFVEGCVAESLGPLDGYVRRSKNWIRECRLDREEVGYTRAYRFSLAGWAFVRFELSSADDISMNLSRDGASASPVVDMSASGYLEGYGTPDSEHLRWAHAPLEPGMYTVEVVTRNRSMPAGFTFTVTAQPTPPPPYVFKSISADGLRSCGLLTDGTALCWGRRGVEGGGAAVPDGKFASISTGVRHNCALREDGSSVCWDFKEEGEYTCAPDDNGGIYCRLNDQVEASPETSDRDGGYFASRWVGVTAGYYDQTPPAGQKFKSISVGWSHTCALRENGAPVCWGSNQYGKSSPPAGASLESISSGTSHTCGLRGDGTALCWGSDTHGQSSPPEGERFVSISAGEEHSCGLRADGEATCWGSGGLEVCKPALGGFYQCTGAGGDEFVPPAPPEGVRFISLSSTDPYCALRLNGSALCWTQYQSKQESPPESERFTSISSSYDHACALRSDGTPVCWGNDRFGQSSPPSGFNMTGSAKEPLPSTRLVSIDAGDHHTCALDQSGKALCWGPNWWRGRFSDRLASISSGRLHSCGLRLDGTIVCRGNNTDGQSSPPDGRFTSLSSGADHTCGLRTDGTVTCWGWNDHGQASPPDDEFVSISSGSAHTCGLRTDGTVTCWGTNDHGRTSPPDGEFVSISSGAFHTCALRSDGSTVCWGSNLAGQSLPPEGESFTSISGGGQHTCALRKDGAAVCWGAGFYYDYGQTSPPTDMSFTSIASGLFHTCGIRSDGVAVCWGSDEFGQTSPHR